MNCVLLLLVGLVPLVCGQSAYIVGGYDANIANFPYQGSLRSYNEHTCGCVLVSSNWVVSAAHCGGSPRLSTVSFGSTDRTRGTAVGVTRVTIHPSYGNGVGSFPNDISVIQLKASVSGANIKPITLGSLRLQGGEKAVISGWGRTCGFCGAPINLRAAQLDILKDSECDRYWGNGYNSNNHVCVFDKINQSKGACSGDSGGPMVSGGVAHGVTSWGISSCSTSYPSVYTRITSYKAWICQVSNYAAMGC